jgi:arsenate reductase-like glutaredoxin family protein
VSSIIGDTAKAKETKGSARYKWTRDEVLGEIAANSGSPSGDAVAKVLEWAEAHGCEIRQGTGSTGSLLVLLPGRDRAFLTFRADGTIVFDYVRHYLRHAPFDDPLKRSELIELLDNLKPGVHAILDRNRISGYALDLSLTDLAETAVQARVIGLLEWTVKLITESA